MYNLKWLKLSQHNDELLTAIRNKICNHDGKYKIQLKTIIKVVENNCKALEKYREHMGKKWWYCDTAPLFIPR